MNDTAVCIGLTVRQQRGEGFENYSTIISGENYDYWLQDSLANLYGAHQTRLHKIMAASHKHELYHGVMLD